MKQNCRKPRHMQTQGERVDNFRPRSLSRQTNHASMMEKSLTQAEVDTLWKNSVILAEKFFKDLIVGAGPLTQRRQEWNGPKGFLFSQRPTL